MLLVKHPQCFAPPGETVALGWWLRGRWFKSNLNICCYPHCWSATSIGKHMKLSLQKSRCVRPKIKAPAQAVSCILQNYCLIVVWNQLWSRSYDRMIESNTRFDNPNQHLVSNKGCYGYLKRDHRRSF